MNLETVRSFFLWCSVINYAVLLLWVVIFWFAHDLALPTDQPVFQAAGRDI